MEKEYLLKQLKNQCNLTYEDLEDLIVSSIQKGDIDLKDFLYRLSLNSYKAELPSKITPDEFFNYKRQICIHCKTQEQAKKLCEVFARVGITWEDGTSYLVDTCWNCYKENTVYYNNGTIGHLLYDAQECSDYVYEFEDVDFEEKE